MFYSSSDSDEKIWFNELDSAENNSRARKAFESVLMLRPRTPNSDQYRNFSQQAAALAVREYGFPHQSGEVKYLILISILMYFFQALN